MTWEKDIEEFRAATRQLSDDLGKVFLPGLQWIDRQLRRFPRFYAWLSR